MPTKTYELTFLNREGEMGKGQVYSDLPAALAAFRDFVELDTAESYAGVTLTEHDEVTGLDRIVAAIAF